MAKSKSYFLSIWVTLLWCFFTNQCLFLKIFQDSFAKKEALLKKAALPTALGGSFAKGVAEPSWSKTFVQDESSPSKLQRVVTAACRLVVLS